MKAPSSEHFLAIPDQLRTLDPEAKAAWGIMTPQHMVEHLVSTWMISNGRFRVKEALSPEEIAKRREFLFSDTPYAKSITNPVQGDGLQKLRKSSLAEAIDQLEREMKTFFEYHNQHPDAIETHPVFGPLDREGWLIFQAKHMGHHMAQFGL